MFLAVKEFKSFQLHSTSHKYLTRKTLRHTDLQHLPQASFSPHKLHHPTPLDIPPSRAPQHRRRRCCSCRGQAAANCCFPSAPLPRPGSGRQRRDGLPFFYGQGAGTDPGEIYRWGSSNQHQADGNDQAVGNYHF